MSQNSTSSFARTTDMDEQRKDTDATNEQNETNNEGEHTNDDEESEQQEDNFVLLCKIDNARIISTVLSALSSKKEGQIATVTIMKEGIKFTVEESKSAQGHAFLNESLFQEYKFTGKHEQFRINFSILMDCLNIYGASSFVAMQIGYGGYGHSLVLLLEEGGVVTHCGLRTLEAEELTNMNFRGYNIPNKVILEAEYLNQAFEELDWSSQQVTLLLSPDAPHFRLSTVSAAGSCQVDYPKDSEVFETFECTETMNYTYKLALLQPAVKALSLAAKTQVRVNQVGLLSLQHMVRNEDKNISFVDFFVAPEEEDDNE